MRGRKWDVKVDAGENSEAPSVKRCLSHPGDEWGLDMRTPETQLLSVLLPDHAESPGNTTPSSSDSLSTCHETYSSQWGMARALVSRSLPRLSVRSQASPGCPLTPTHFTVPDLCLAPCFSGYPISSCLKMVFVLRD